MVSCQKGYVLIYVCVYVRIYTGRIADKIRAFPGEPLASFLNRCGLGFCRGVCVGEHIAVQTSGDPLNLTTSGPLVRPRLSRAPNGQKLIESTR